MKAVNRGECIWLFDGEENDRNIKFVIPFRSLTPADFSVKLIQLLNSHYNLTLWTLSSRIIELRIDSRVSFLDISAEGEEVGVKIPHRETKTTEIGNYMNH